MDLYKDQALDFTHDALADQIRAKADDKRNRLTRRTAVVTTVNMVQPGTQPSAANDNSTTYVTYDIKLGGSGMVIPGVRSIAGFVHPVGATVEVTQDYGGGVIIVGASGSNLQAFETACSPKTCASGGFTTIDTWGSPYMRGDCFSFNQATGALTTKYSGWYLFYAAGTLNGSSAGTSRTMMIAGTTLGGRLHTTEMGPGGNTLVAMECGWQGLLLGTQTFNVQIFQNSGVNLTFGAINDLAAWWSVIYLGP